MAENLNYEPTSGNTRCHGNVSTNCDTYGRIYEWKIAMNNASSSNTVPSDVQGVCPDGWHLPSDTEWKELEMEVGLSQVDADKTSWRGTNQAIALKTSSWGGDNSSGFTALPGGYQGGGVTWHGLGTGGYWWSATEENGSKALRRHLSSTRNELFRGGYDKVNGHSVRCVKN